MASCTKCGGSLPEDMTICPSCGAFNFPAVPPNAFVQSFSAWLRDALFDDDLLVRVAYLFFGIMLISFAAYLTYSFASEGEPVSSWPFRIFVVAFLLTLFIWGIACCSRCFASPNSKLARLALYPPSAEGEAMLALVVVCLFPAVAVTLAFKAMGIRGRMWPNPAYMDSPENQD